MAARSIVVLGGGFAGLWSALGAARKLDELGVRPESVEVTLVNRDAFHSIRVRNYEPNLNGIRVPLDDVLHPVGVRRVEGIVDALNLPERQVRVATPDGTRVLTYDRLVFALGSQLARPPIQGLAEHAFDVDTYDAAVKLESHLRSLGQRPNSPGRFTAVVVGAGLTGIEAVSELPGRLREEVARIGAGSIVSGDDHDVKPRVIVIDHNDHVGSDMGDSARPIIENALGSLGIETRLGVRVVEIDPSGVTLSTGETIPAETVLWCAGMRAHPLTAQVPVECDHLGRLPVDETLRVVGVENVFAAGDAARAMMDEVHCSVMSCQHSRPMGRFAGHNVVADLFGLPLLPLRIRWYATILDLGPAGAVYTEGWDRVVTTTGERAKRTKEEINRHRIYPPLNRNRADLLAAAAPTVQSPPER